MATTGGEGVYGQSNASSGGGSGVFGYNGTPAGAGQSAIGVYGLAGTGSWSYFTGIATGVEGFTNRANDIGVLGWTNTVGGYAVYGRAASSTANWAAYFWGNVNVTGTLTKGGGAFKIDHPLDPANKYLYHSFVESPDMKNIYDGVVTLGPDGTAWVTLPDWFEALNKDVRYQLTCIGGYAPVYISQKIQNNRFQIAGGTPGLEVSWQVTGIRRDPWAEANRIPVEQWKAEPERGKYLYPGLYGQPPEKGIGYMTAVSAPAGSIPTEVKAMAPRMEAREVVP
jgi:hypothetical protein